MSQIDPLQASLSITNNPFLYDLLVQRSGATEAQQAATNQKLEQEAPDYDRTVNLDNVDPERLRSDVSYLHYFLDRVMWRARYHFFMGHYDAAAEQYRLFFDYVKYYGKIELGLTNSFYYAMFERAWVGEIKGNHEDNERFLNEQLLHMLEWMKDPKSDKAMEITPTQHNQLNELIKSMQRLGQLPSAMNLDQHISTEHLVTLMSYMLNHGENQTAGMMLHHIEVRQMLSLFRVEHLAQKLFTDKKGQKEVMSPFLMALLAAEKGLPMAPVFPVPTEETKKTQATQVQETETVKFDARMIQPIFALGKDPNEDEKRKRRFGRLKDRSDSVKKAYPRVESIDDDEDVTRID